MTQNLSNIYSDPNANKWRVDEGSSQIWGEICLERKWLWTLKRKGGHGGRRLGIFAEREEITPLGGDSKISDEDLPLWIGDSKIRINGSEENLETWEKTHFFIKLKSEYKCVSQWFIYYGSKHQKAKHNKRSDKAQTKTLQKL